MSFRWSREGFFWGLCIFPFSAPSLIPLINSFLSLSSMKATTIVCDGCGNEIKKSDQESNQQNDVGYWHFIPVHSIQKNINANLPVLPFQEPKDICKECYAKAWTGINTP